MTHPDDERYFLDRDDSGHWYLVFESHRGAWNDWRSLDGDDEESWTCPKFAYRLAGGPSSVTFSKPTAKLINT